ncbi:MAG: FkbM family methyltransferase [Fluviicola sp.]|nr:FkbM family methyltransferase [Fluviicola sp.]
MSIPNRSFLLRHKLISMLRDIDLRGFRRLSVVLPKLLLPNPEKTGKHILKTIHGVELLIDPSVDKGVELSLFETGTYEKGTIQLLGDFLKPGSTFMDVGANIGLMSVIASRLVGEKGRVLAVEANLKTVEILNQNAALNHCENVDVYPVALGSENGKATLYENWEVNRGGASLLSQDNSEGTEVPLWKLDELFGDLTIDLIKMDVEGFELEVLKGGINLLKATLPVLIIEVSEQREQEKGVTPKEIADFVKTIGNYQLFKQKGTKERRSKLIPILTDADLPKHDNLVCVPMKRLDR